MSGVKGQMKPSQNVSTSRFTTAHVPTEFSSFSMIAQPLTRTHRHTDIAKTIRCFAGGAQDKYDNKTGLQSKANYPSICVFSDVRISCLLLPWPWPWPDDLDMWTSPRYSEAVPAYQKCFRVKAFSSYSTNRTDRHDRTHYHCHIPGRQ